MKSGHINVCVFGDKSRLRLVQIAAGGEPVTIWEGTIESARNLSARLAECCRALEKDQRNAE